MKVTITGFVHLQKKTAYEDPNSPPVYVVFSFDATGSTMGYMMVGPASFEYEIPAEWNPVAAEVSALEKQKAEALAEYQKTVAHINGRLSKLLALTNEVDA